MLIPRTHTHHTLSPPPTQEFKEFVMKDEKTAEKITNLKQRVEEFADRFPIPGFDSGLISRS